MVCHAFLEKLGLSSRILLGPVMGSEASGKIIFQMLSNIITKVFVVAVKVLTQRCEKTKASQ